MVAPLNPNDSRVLPTCGLVPPRHLGRGQALDNNGLLTQVTWVSGNVLVRGAGLFTLAEQPSVLDLSFDQNNRPIVPYRIGAGSYVYYYSPLGAGGYVSEPIGAAIDPAVSNDFILRGNSIVCVYLGAGNALKFRLHADRWAVEYPLDDRRLASITHFGVCIAENTLAVLGAPLS